MGIAWLGAGKNQIGTMMIRTNRRMPTDGLHRLPAKRKGEVTPGGARPEGSRGCIRFSRQTRSRYPAYVRANARGRARRAATTSPPNQKKMAAGEGGGPLGIEMTMNGPMTSAHSRRARFRILRRTAGSIPTDRAERERTQDGLPRLSRVRFKPSADDARFSDCPRPNARRHVASNLRFGG